MRKGSPLSSETYKPKRHLRNEIYSLALVMLAPLGIALIFPYESIGWRASEKADEISTQSAKSSCAFIRLGPNGEEAAVSATRSSMKTSAEGVVGGRIRANLSLSEIPEETGDIADISDRKGVNEERQIVKRLILPRPPSLAAPKAELIIASPPSPDLGDQEKSNKQKFDLLELDE